jgi:hypothetical protein
MGENEYPKINSMFKRDEKGKMIPEFSESAFKYLAKNEWIGTEKVDGMGVRIEIIPLMDGDGCSLQLMGRTDNTRIPQNLSKHYWRLLVDKLSIQNIKKVFPCLSSFHSITLYGEAYGEKIQKAGKQYCPNGGVGIVIFDIKIATATPDGDVREEYWLERHNVEDIVRKLDLDVVPIIFQGSLWDAIAFISKDDITTKVTRFPVNIEGLVLQPSVPLQDRRGNRIITKIKVKDLKKLPSNFPLKKMNFDRAADMI